MRRSSTLADLQNLLQRSLLCYPSVPCFAILKLSNTDFIDVLRLFDWDIFIARTKLTCILSEPCLLRNIGPSKEAVACVIIPANVDTVSPYL